MKRAFDITVSAVSFVLLLPVFLLVSLAVKLTSRGPVFHISERVGRDNQNFWMFKFRTMRMDTPHVATHKMGDPKQYLTPIGGFLRKSSFDWAQINGRDELPIPDKVKLDVYYLENRSFRLDLLILFRTATNVLKRKGVSH